MTERKCISCGMPLTKAEDHAAGDVARDWCRHCGDERGDLKPYEDVLFGMTMFMVQTQGMDEGVARTAATQMLSNMPAWRERAPSN